MPAVQWELAHPEPVALGEGPAWDPTRMCLWFVDTMGKAVLQWRAGSASMESRTLDSAVGFAIPTVDGELVVGLEDGVHLLSWDGEPSPHKLCAVPDADDPTVRVNDGCCDPQGRLWFGTVGTDFREGASTLFRLTDTGALPVVPGGTLANGLGWSPAGDVLYFVDSRRRKVSAFAYDLTRGAIGDERVFLDLAEETSFADGLTVDGEGCVWVAMYLGSEVRRYDPAGRLMDRFPLPVEKVTSVCFGGPGLRDLYVTSARFGIPPDRLAHQPLAGCLFVLPDVATGQATVPFDPATIL